MFFQAKEATRTLDTYDRAHILITAVLHHECPEHSPRHHLLYTTNQKLAHYCEAKDYYRKQIDPYTAIGLFSKQSYELAYKKYNQLSLAIRAYMHLADAAKREFFNHHLSFHNDKIALLFEHYEHHTLYKLHNEQAFWQALKDDLLPLFTQLE